MRLMRGILTGAICICIGVASPEFQPVPGSCATRHTAKRRNAAAGNLPAGEAQASPEKKTYTVPAGTKVLLQIRSAVNTKSAKPGDGVYLASTFPVVVGSRVMIPAGVYVQGVVDRVARAGRVKGRAQLDIHFTSIIFPNGSLVEIPGIVNSLPGARDRSVKGDEGTIEQDPNKGRDVARAAEIGLGGASVGTIGGAAAGHPLEGAAIGGLGGVAVGTVVALLTRGDDSTTEPGTAEEHGGHVLLSRSTFAYQLRVKPRGGNTT